MARGLWESFTFEPPLIYQVLKKLAQLELFFALCRLNYEHRSGGKKQIDIQKISFGVFLPAERSTFDAHIFLGQNHQWLCEGSAPIQGC